MKMNDQPANQPNESGEESPAKKTLAQVVDEISNKYRVHEDAITAYAMSCLTTHFMQQGDELPQRVVTEIQRIQILMLKQAEAHQAEAQQAEAQQGPDGRPLIVES
tara:strand:- start:420 stop:737 length:318 start_codon:yes stop_codon:yes gene_type:complete